MLFNDIPGCRDIKPIGFGPNIMNYSPKYRKERGNLFLFFLKVYNRSFFRYCVLPFKKRKYAKCITNAIKQGFRLIDFSAAYGNQDQLGKAIRNSGLPRGSLFLTTRITNRAQLSHNIREEFFRSIHDLGVDYVDLLQFHWPVKGVYLETWKEMEKLKDEGYVRHLGTANCHQHHIEEILKICKYKPEISQFEIHPLFSQKPLVDFYKKNGIIIEAYTPVARCDDRLVRLPLLKKIGDKYNKSIIQVVLRWHVQNGIVPVVRAMSFEHQRENIDIFDFNLTDDEMASIDAININSRLRYDPDNCDFSIL